MDGNDLESNFEHYEQLVQNPSNSHGDLVEVGEQEFELIEHCSFVQRTTLFCMPSCGQTKWLNGISYVTQLDFA